MAMDIVNYETENETRASTIFKKPIAYIGRMLLPGTLLLTNMWDNIHVPEELGSWNSFLNKLLYNVKVTKAKNLKY